MSVEMKVESGGIFKKKITFEQLSEGLSFGVTNENYCLDMGQKSENTVLYDAGWIGRGIEVSLNHEGSSVTLRLSLPSDENEICLFYHLAGKACSLLGAKHYLRDGEKVLSADSQRLMELDRQASVKAMKDIIQKVSSGEYKYYYIFGAFFPLTLGKEELSCIGSDLHKLGSWLNEKQQLDAYYANPRVYQRSDGTLFGVYAVTADVRSILPTEPYIIMNQIKNIHDWFAMLGSSSKMVPYADFTASVKGEYFDANHIVLTLSQQELDVMAEKYAVEI